MLKPQINFHAQSRSTEQKGLQFCISNPCFDFQHFPTEFSLVCQASLFLFHVARMVMRAAAAIFLFLYLQQLTCPTCSRAPICGGLQRFSVSLLRAPGPEIKIQQVWGQALVCPMATVTVKQINPRNPTHPHPPNVTQCFSQLSSLPCIFPSVPSQACSWQQDPASWLDTELGCQNSHYSPSLYTGKDTKGYRSRETGTVCHWWMSLSPSATVASLG